MLKKFLLISSLLLLSNCASKQSYIGAKLQHLFFGTACWQYISDNPAVVATCAVAGSFKGADIMNGETDDQLMTRAFIDHLENKPNNLGFTNGKILNHNQVVLLRRQVSI